MFILFNEGLTTAVAVVDSVVEQEKQYAFVLPKNASTCLPRWTINRGKLVDMYPDKTDEEVLAAAEAAAKTEAETQAASLRALKSSQSSRLPVTRVNFMNRFTMIELAGIYTLAKTEVMVEIFLEKLRLAENVDISSEDTKAGINALVSLKLLTAERAAEILQ